jgi:hypothetical protein
MNRFSSAKLLLSCVGGLLMGFSGMVLLMLLTSVGWQVTLVFLGLALIYALIELVLIHIPIDLWRGWRKSRRGDQNASAEAQPSDPTPVWPYRVGFWICFAIPILASLPSVALSLSEQTP